jgi:hypothetical protein
MISSLTSFVESFGIAPAPAGIVAVLSFLVIVGLVVGVYQQAKESRRRAAPLASRKQP